MDSDPQEMHWYAVFLYDGTEVQIEAGRVSNSGGDLHFYRGSEMVALFFSPAGFVRADAAAA